MVQFDGVFSSMITPFTGTNNINYDSLERLVEKFISDNLDGIYVLGDMGEFSFLTFREKREIIKFVCKTSCGRLDTIINVGSSSFEETRKLAGCAELNGASAISSVVPLLYGDSFEKIKKYYSELSGLGMPIIIHNVSNGIKGSLSVENIIELSEIDNVVGMNHVSSNMYIIERIKTKMPHFTVFCGYDEMWLSSNTVGADGLIGGFCNFMGEKFKHILTYYAAHKNEYALEEQRRVNSIVEAVVKIGKLQSVKYIMNRKFGIECGGCRVPFAVLAEENKKTIDEVMEKFSDI